MKWKSSIFFIYISVHLLIVYFPQILSEKIKKVLPIISKRIIPPVQAVPVQPPKDCIMRPKNPGKIYFNLS